MFNWFPENVSTFGGDIDAVFRIIFWGTFIWFVLAEGAILFFALRYRRRGDSRAVYVTGERGKQAAWILVPAAIVLFLDLAVEIAGGHAYEKVKGEIPEGDVKLRLTAEQFGWTITYPGPDAQFDTPDDQSMLTEMHVPVNKIVNITLTSKDVIHSFFAPQLRLKQDALPGRQIPIWFSATQPGTYEIACAELCGLGHSKMRGFIFVHSDEDYAKWVTETWGTQEVGSGQAAVDSEQAAEDGTQEAGGGMQDVGSR